MDEVPDDETVLHCSTCWCNRGNPEHRAIARAQRQARQAKTESELKRAKAAFRRVHQSTAQTTPGGGE